MGILSLYQCQCPCVDVGRIGHPEDVASPVRDDVDEGRAECDLDFFDFVEEQGARLYAEKFG